MRQRSHLGPILLQQYDYLMRIDDDSWFKKKINYNIFEKLEESNKLCGTGYTCHQTQRAMQLLIEQCDDAG